MRVNRKVFVSLLIVAVIAIAFPVLVLAKGLAQVPAPIVTPDWLVALIAGAVGFIVTAGLKDLSKVVPWLPDLSGGATALTGAIVTVIVLIINLFLSAIPPSFQPVASAIFVAIAAILTAYGINNTFNKFKAK